jgi:hypothetical protein
MLTRRTIGVLVAFLCGISPAVAQTPAATPAGALFSLVNRPGSFLVTDGLISLIGSEAATFPVGLAAGGFTWERKAGSLVQTRSSESFGPMFAYRPLTNGKRKLLVGLSFQHISFSEVDGVPLDDIRTTGIPSPGDSATLSLSVDIDRTVLSASYGVTDAVDVGVVMPFGRTSVSGTQSTVSRGLAVPVASADVSSWSSGDISVVGKAKLLSNGPVNLAAALELRLPTGDTESLLGTGAAQLKTMFIGGLNRKVAPHFNVGYVFGGEGFTPSGGAGPLSAVTEGVHPSPEFDYTFGADVALTPRVTLVGDVIGRSLRKSAYVVLLTGITYTELYEATRVVNLVLGALSAKILLGDSWLLTGSLVFPLNNNGLVPRVSPVIGFERPF